MIANGMLVLMAFLSYIAATSYSFLLRMILALKVKHVPQVRRLELKKIRVFPVYQSKAVHCLRKIF